MRLRIGPQVQALSRKMLMGEQPATFDVNEIRDPAIRLNGLDGVDARYTFYYDETNNIRRLSVAENGFNVAEPQVFVLGGIVHVGSPRDLSFADLRSALRLQPTVKELKFEHVAHGDFLTVLGSRKLSNFLEWLDEQEVNLHYLSLDPLYWATVDIVDSIIAGDARQLALVAPQLKNDLFGLLREDREATADFFFRFGYPDLKASHRSTFMGELLDLLECQSESLPHFNHYMLKGLLQIGARSEALPFIEDETPHLLIGEFSSFFVHRICLFKNSWHILDDEEVVKAAIGDRRFVDAGKPLDPYRFSRSHDEHGIQISDVVVGLLGKCLSWLNNNDLGAIEQTLGQLNAAQHANRRRLNALLDHSNTVCRAFSQHILSLEDQRRGALFLTA